MSEGTWRRPFQVCRELNRSNRRFSIRWESRVSFCNI